MVGSQGANITDFEDGREGWAFFLGRTADLPWAPPVFLFGLFESYRPSM